MKLAQRLDLALADGGEQFGISTIDGTITIHPGPPGAITVWLPKALGDIRQS